MELVGGCYQTVIEVVTRNTKTDFILKQFLQGRRLNLRCRTGEDDALALLDRHLEIARYIEVLIRGIATLLLLRVLDTTIPVRLEYELVLL